MRIGNWLLVDKTTNEPVNKGDTITDFRGSTHIMGDAIPPHKPGASGYVVVVYDDSNGLTCQHHCYASVFGLVWKNTTPIDTI